MISCSPLFTPTDTYQILEESEYGTIRFEVPFHFHSRVQSATSSTQNAARSRRLAQEVATLSTSLPLSPSSSVFVRCDEERLDVMKVSIAWPVVDVKLVVVQIGRPVLTYNLHNTFSEEDTNCTFFTECNGIIS